MPLAAVVDRFAPPARAVVVSAAANVPTVRTVEEMSTLKSTGSVEEDVALLGMPIPSKVCQYALPVVIEIAAKATYVAGRVVESTPQNVSSLRMGAQILAERL